MSSIIIDTGFLIALLHTKDPHHQAAIDAADRYEKTAKISSMLVLHESFWFLTKHASAAKANKLLLFAHEKIKFPHFPSNWIPRAQSIIDVYHVDLADASLVILAEELEHGDILTVDRRDFTYLRWNKSKPFNNCLYP